MENSSVLVTGSSRGIGRSVALALADKGYDIVLHCRNGLELAEGVAEHITAGGGQARIQNFG